jgi:predicted acylesterase/phospholipase RssA
METNCEDTLVLGSGGIKGFAFLGVCKVLEERGLLTTVKNYIGCSIGSIICFLLACGLTCSELLGEFINKDFEDILKDGLVIEDMISKMGVFNKNTLRKFINEIIAKKMGVEDAEKLTFKDLSELTDKNFYCVTTDLDGYSTKVYGPQMTPEEQCIEAVLASCSIPFIFQGTEIPNGFLVDGAITDPVGLRIAFQVSQNRSNIYCSFFTFKPLAIQILDKMLGRVSERMEGVWDSVADKYPPPLEHSKAKESGIIVNILSHGHRLYQSITESLVENYIFRHIFENELSGNPRKLILIPLPNFNANVSATPESKVHMYFSGGDFTNILLNEYSV